MPDSTAPAPLTSSAPSAASPSSSSPSVAWAALISYLREWFDLSDSAVEAFKAVFLAALVHSIPECEPVWCMVTGVPGSGKTSVAIRCLSAFPGAYVMSGISENTLLSSFGNSKKQRKESSLLHRLGPTPRILIKDFTTLLSKREHVRDEVFAQLRELHDGQLRSDRGNGESVEWQGKATVIAAVTPAVERKWDAMRELGERFLLVRWPKGDPFVTGRLARRQGDKTIEGSGAMRIKATQLRLTSALISTFQSRLADPPVVSPEIGERLDALAEIVGMTRAQVIRDSHGKRSVIDICAYEATSRVSSALQSIAIGAAMLHGVGEVGESELALARRVALDTIPIRRARILNTIPHAAPIEKKLIQNTLNLPIANLNWNLTEMRHIGIIEPAETLLGSAVAFTPGFRTLRELAGLAPSKAARKIEIVRTGALSD
ncbi:MAG: hypothetical protein KGL39_16020 [Patescibacteria group bacterium]|nr:hypothetical protein [Patescibacteria group bacterium]